MNSIVIRAAIATLSVAFLQAGLGQTDAAPLTRSEVKAETRAAETSHQLTPAGEAVYPLPQKQPPSTYTRKQRKSTTLLARKSGDLLPAGDAAVENKAAKDLAHAPRSTKTRAQRKAETLAAAKAHQLIPAGEGPTN
jgi:hypothetical protein